MTNAALRGKPDAGNPHVRFDEGASASEKPRRNALLHNALLLCAAFASALATDGWLVVNEDNDHFFKLGDEWQTKEGLGRYLDIVLKGQVTHFFMCVNGQRTSYDSKTWEPIWAGLNDVARKDTATAPDGTHDRWAVNAKKFFDAGIDPYEVWTKRCREKGVSPWISMRMNDVHYLAVSNYFRNTIGWGTDPAERTFYRASAISTL